MKLRSIPIVPIDLDLPPEERWSGLPGFMRRSASTLSRRIDQETPSYVGPLMRVLTKFRNPFRSDIEALASVLGVPFNTALAGNFAYELTSASTMLSLGCTSGVTYNPKLGLVHIRTLDWEMEGLGKYAVIFKFEGAPAGLFYSIGWPSYVGVLTGMAPGRFSASINFAVPRPRQIPSLQWPPSHLLRYVFENCRTYETALRTIRAAKFCAPTLITLAGTKPGEAVIIECSEQRNRIYRMREQHPIAVANDYLSGELRQDLNGLEDGTQRADEVGPEGEIFAPQRKGTMLNRLGQANFSSIRDALRPLNSYPIRNYATKLQISMSAAFGQLAVYGVEKMKRVSFGAIV